MGDALLKADAAKKGLSYREYCHEFGLSEGSVDYEARIYETTISQIPKAKRMVLIERLYGSYED